ncbi:unnamed protein product (macronuclear) [Paramecium tetraurelia]|uniref:Uncharacterized protein n=1 Tax=Paramecium tetraurelia TaxID=5888 RepID=A0BCJ4_PARTE|nr:uncharacterized protein GSPATT00004355001 [Paramecium tetraurelia]CAK56261.1 unnamed protein product [Paramecium tetraurelia]|eukprot:XP_001423659.1 hypothetical protein (macronuclear) [Paramecium tetraurelia strain d4-2]
MNFIQLGKLKNQLANSKSNIPKIQQRRYSRVNSIEQLISYQNYQKENLEQIDKYPFKKITQDQSSQIDKPEQKERSQSLTHIQQQYQINSHRLINQQKITKTTNNIEINYSKQGIQLLQIHQKRQNLNEALNSILQQKINNLNARNFRSNSNLPALNSQQGKLSDQSKINQFRKLKQYDFESQLPEGPQLSFRQFAKMQGLKLPQFLE